MKSLSLISGLLLFSACAQPTPSALVVAAESQSMIWNSVALSDTGEVFVSGPRWTGSMGPALAHLDKDGQPQPYPDARWNGWQPGQDAHDAFVNLNGIHRGSGDSLWAIDTGAPEFGGAPLPGGAKVVHIDLKSGQVVRIYPLGSEVATPTSYVDDIRFHGSRGYLTDAGRPGLIVLDLETGSARRVLDNATSTTGPADRPIVVDGQTVHAPDGSPLRVNTDFLEVSPDGTWLYFASLHGPWYRVERRWVDEARLSPEELESHVEPWADLPPSGGSAMDTDGNLYFSDLAENALKKRTPEGHIETVITDARLHWVDSPYLAPDGWLWLPASQIDRVALFNGGASRVERPVRLLRLRVR
jgi:sugar lactone lactonase YvrE